MSHVDGTDGFWDLTSQTSTVDISDMIFEDKSKVFFTFRKRCSANET